MCRRNSRTVPEIGERLSQVLLETMAAIHAVDTAAIGLDDLGRPEGFLARAVTGWRKRGWSAKEDGTETLASGDRRLAGTQDRAGRQTPDLLHNDFKLNNMILNPETFRRSPWWTGTRAPAAIRCSISQRC